MICYMLWGSLVTKVKGREAILDLVPWSGDQQVLDVGCGRGLLLVGAAHRLTSGRAVGIDLWLARDQSGNEKPGALTNRKRRESPIVSLSRLAICGSSHTLTMPLMLCCLVAGEARWVRRLRDRESSHLTVTPRPPRASAIPSTLAIRYCQRCDFAAARQDHRCNARNANTLSAIPLHFLQSLGIDPRRTRSLLASAKEIKLYPPRSSLSKERLRLRFARIANIGPGRWTRFLASVIDGR